MPFFAILLVASLRALPCEYIIDFGPAVRTPFAFKMVIILEACDGTVTDDMKWEWAEDVKLQNVRDITVSLLHDWGWDARPGAGNSLIVRGTNFGNKSPILRVRVESKMAIPVTVRWVPLVPEKKK